MMDGVVSCSLRQAMGTVLLAAGNETSQRYKIAARTHAPNREREKMIYFDNERNNGNETL